MGKKKMTAEETMAEALAVAVAASGINGNAHDAALGYLTAVALKARGEAAQEYVANAFRYSSEYGNRVTTEIVVSAGMGRINPDGTLATAGRYMDGGDGVRLAYWTTDRTNDEYGYGWTERAGLDGDRWGTLPPFVILAESPDTSEADSE